MKGKLFDEFKAACHLITKFNFASSGIKDSTEGLSVILAVYGFAAR